MEKFYRMSLSLFCLIILIYCNLAENLNSNNNYYIAGVVEYGSDIENVEKFPAKYIQDNVNAYLHFIDLAKEQNVDILVFPEATLNYFLTRSTMLENAFLIPNPSEKIAPWENEIYSEYLRAISKKCKDKRIYVLINLVEKIKSKDNEYKLYNTNVVFDRNGRVISKYQKYNLFNEPLIDQPLIPQHSVFTTDFGVKFGHFICFDILFKEPGINLLRNENVSNILYPSKWYSEIPFLVSNQIHQGWAFVNNVNLISSGSNSPKDGNSGSGIYIGQQKINQIFISPFLTQKLITASVPKNLYNNQEQNQYASPSLISTALNDNKFTPVQMQKLRIYEFWSKNDIKIYDISNGLQTICMENDEMCCNFDIKMKTSTSTSEKIAYKYKLTINHTSRRYGSNRNCGEIYCAVIACKNDDSKSCGKRFNNNANLLNNIEFEYISITMKIKNYNQTMDILVMPSTIDVSISPLDINSYRFTKTDLNKNNNNKYWTEFKMQTTTKIKDILTFGLFGRDFSLDRSINSAYK